MNRKERKKREVLEKKALKEKLIIQFDMGGSVELLAAGPLIRTSIGIIESHKKALIDAGQPVPPPVYCTLLIDTGASNTLIKHDIAEKAGLKLINANAPVHGVGVDSTGRTYLGAIIFAIKSKISPNAGRVVSVNSEISSGALPGAPQYLDGLLGRDVLQYFDLIYQGHNGQFSLQYIPPSPIKK